MEKENMIIDDLMHDKTSKYYESLIEMQSKNPTLFNGVDNDITVKSNERSKTKKLTKCYTRGRINK